MMAIVSRCNDGLHVNAPMLAFDAGCLDCADGVEVEVEGLDGRVKAFVLCRDFRS